ncbi:MAG: hypothetical protein QY326_02090 [Bdellovibrionota bacterium]|nr:MAG: hypothetical protein QY326_02090 [Bdellovibrionota bacterium]
MTRKSSIAVSIHRSEGMRTINSVMGLVGTLILTVIMGQSAHADIIKDNLNQFTGEIPYHRIFASYEPSGKTSLGVTIPGNGQKVSQISFVMSLDYGDYTPNHPAEEGDFTIRAGFHPDVTSYIDDPFCWDPQNPNYFQEFDTSGHRQPWMAGCYRHLQPTSTSRASTTTST